MSHHMLSRKARREQARKTGVEFKPLYSAPHPDAKIGGVDPQSPYGRALATIERINRGGR